MYRETNKNKPYTLKLHKGHLVPAETYSFSPDHLRSTFTYTNAVPQYGTFNCGEWAQSEKLIREKAKKCSEKNGNLYLLTGVAEEIGMPESRMPVQPKIVIPDYMWTAGCCVSVLNQDRLDSFAVIGKNVPDVHKINMSTWAVNVLGAFIGNVNLFPANPNC